MQIGFSYIYRVFLKAALLVSVLFLNGCKLSLLDPQGPIASEEKRILLIATAMMLLVVIPVILLTLFFAWRYRAQNSNAKYTPEWAHSLILETLWWSVSCFIIGILGAITWFSTHQLDPYKPLAVKKTNTLTIQAIALNWKWLFIYPEQNIATVNFVQFPVGVQVRFLITAEGPMNSLQIPQLAGQIYAMAGMQTKLHLLANKVGDYQGMSANFSGEGFSDMKFIARACTETAFKNWVAQIKHAPHHLNLATYEHLAKPSINNRVEYFSLATPEIFNTVLMKNMMPMNETTPKRLTQVKAHASTNTIR